jgi:tetratricopeptide (TPR) repeat protein
VKRGFSVRTAHHLGIAVFFVVALGVAGVARGATPEETSKARQHFQRGRVHFDLKEYPQALEEWKDAYRYVQDPILLFNIGQCHYKLEHWDEALSFYRNYLRRAPEAKTGAPPVSTGPPSTSPRPVEPPSGGPPAAAPPPSVSSPDKPPGGLIPPPVASSVPPPDSSPVTLTGTSDTGEPPAIYKRWYFWAGVGAVVLTGVIITAAASRGGTETGQCALEPCLRVGGK